MCLCLLPGLLRAEGVTVFAAASLKTALEEIAADFEGAVTFSFAGSSVLARQVAAGAPADVVMLANVTWMDWLAGQNAIVPETRRDLLGNRLVLVANSAEPPGRAFDLLKGGDVFSGYRMAMGLVEAVPAGIYGRQALVSLGLWESVRDDIVQTDNVRAALALVALGEVPLGIVYASDAQAEPRVMILAEFQADSHDPIVYPAALTDGAGKQAARFLDYLSSAEARRVFEDHGFAVPTP